MWFENFFLPAREAKNSRTTFFRSVSNNFLERKSSKRTRTDRKKKSPNRREKLHADAGQSQVVSFFQAFPICCIAPV
ncbi:hypothetical protein HR15_05900 [Porphyromonas gulae]|uniref:Uncharacterized protein n=1 Tax=Porphyromonas gulae TaxID=111105 RepID=A0A0A2FCT3_9PORP|nr:hypothetical protein HR15_05900 [Porphyromonas gulae]